MWQTYLLTNISSELNNQLINDIFDDELGGFVEIEIQSNITQEVIPLHHLTLTMSNTMDFFLNIFSNYHRKLRTETHI